MSKQRGEVLAAFFPGLPGFLPGCLSGCLPDCLPGWTAWLPACLADPVHLAASSPGSKRRPLHQRAARPHQPRSSDGWPAGWPPGQLAGPANYSAGRPLSQPRPPCLGSLPAPPARLRRPACAAEGAACHCGGGTNNISPNPSLKKHLLRNCGRRAAALGRCPPPPSRPQLPGPSDAPRAQRRAPGSPGFDAEKGDPGPGAAHPL